MKILVSPTKTMSNKSLVINGLCTTPKFLAESNEINNALKNWNQEELKLKMKLSEKLKTATYNLIHQWTTDFKQNKHAVFSYQGTAFKHMELSSWADEEYNFAQSNLLILSAYYGVLLPFDMISAYRLEMGIRHQILEGYKDLYSLWKEKITNYLNNQDIDFVLNLASKEYSDAIDKKQVKAKWVDCNFYDYKNNEFKIIGNYAKAARGLMVNYIVKNKINSVQGVKQFNVNNYRFDEVNSTTSELKFIRKN